MTEDPSFWDWLWFTALDGIGGGLLGGAIAAWALSRTIRHERRLRDEERRNAEVDTLRQQVLQFREVVHDAVFTLDRDNAADLLRIRIQISQATHACRAVARVPAPGLSALLDEFNREFTRIASADEIDWLAFDLLTAAIHAHAFIWIGNPEVFEGDDRPSLYDPVEDEMAEEQEAEELGAESAD